MSVDQLPPGRASAPQRGAQLVRYDEYIDKQIEATRRMVKTVDVMTALLLMATGTLGFLLTAAIVEHWLVPGGFNLGVRLLLFASLLGSLLYFAARRLWPLVAGSINPAYAAQTIERDNPSLKNSLLNLLLFRQHRDDVTDAVYETLEEQAARRLTRVPVDAAVDRTQLLRLGYVLVAIVAAVALYKIFSPKDPFITAERVLMPWARIVPPSRVSIENVEPGAVTLARGEVLTVSADVRGIGEDDPVVIKYTTADGQAVDRPASMTPSNAGLRFTGQLPPASDGAKVGVAQNLKYRIEAGDARSLEYPVTVVAAPTITVEKIDYDYPAYTLYVDRSVERLGDIRAIEGTRVTIHARANGPIEEAEIDFEADGRRDVRLESAGSDANASFTLELREDRRTPQHTSYVLRFTGSDGRPNRDPAKFPIDVTPDRAPEVSITAPAEKTRDVRLDETVAIEVDAIDTDFALSDVRLHGESAGKPVLDEKLLVQEHTGRFRGRLLFTPIEHNLKPGDVVRYWVAARDNRTPTANEVASDSQSLRIVGGQPDQRQQKQNGQRDERDQQQNNDQSQEGKQQEGEQQEGEGGQSGGQGADSSEGSEQGKPNEGDASQSESTQGESAEGESASADGNSDQTGEQSPENQSGESNSGESGANENGTGEGQSPSAGQDKPGNQQQQPGESSESGEGGERSEQNQSRQPGGNNSGSDQNAANQSENQPGADNQSGQQGGKPREGDSSQDSERQSGTGGEPKSGSESKPVSPEGDNDGEAFERIQDFLDREGQLPKEDQEQPKDSPSESGETNSGEPASAGGENASSSDSAKPTESPNSDSKNPTPADPNGKQQPNSDANSDSQPGESQEKSNDQSQPSGDKQSPEGQHTSSEGESGAGEEPKEGQGSPESQQPGEQPDKWQQKPSGDKPGDEQGEQEAPSGGHGDRKNDSQAGEGGDRSGGGEEGAGQKSEREGTGSSGQNQSADEVAGESSEQGAGENSPDAGQDSKSNDATGQSGSDEKGDGSSQREGQGEQPGGNEQQPGEPASAGGDQPKNSTTDTKNEAGENQSESPESPEAPNANAGEQQNPGNQPGASNSADGAGRVPDGVIQPSNSSGTAPDADAANLEYAKKQTDLVLETLDEQMKRQKVDKRLLDKLGWTEADLKRFLDRWRQLKDAAARDESPVADEAQRELDDALRSLGLRRGQLQQAKVSDDQNRDLNQGFRGAIPLEYQERLRAYNQGVSRAEQSDE